MLQLFDLWLFFFFHTADNALLSNSKTDTVVKIQRALCLNLCKKPMDRSSTWQATPDDWLNAYASLNVSLFDNSSSITASQWVASLFL